MDTADSGRLNGEELIGTGSVVAEDCSSGRGPPMGGGGGGGGTLPLGVACSSVTGVGSTATDLVADLDLLILFSSSFFLFASSFLFLQLPSLNVLLPASFTFQQLFFPFQLTYHP